MDICSYLVHLSPNADSSAVATQLSLLPGCEATPAENDGNLLILVTETEGKEADKALRKRIESIPDIECLALVFGAQEPYETASTL